MSPIADLSRQILFDGYNMDTLVVTQQAPVLLWRERAVQLLLLARCLRQLQLQSWGSLGVVRSGGGKRCGRYEITNAEQSLYII